MTRALARSPKSQGASKHAPSLGFQLFPAGCIPPASGRDLDQHSSEERRLQLLPKGLLRLVMLVSMPLIEAVRPLSNHILTHRHPATAHPSRPLLRRLEKRPAHSAAPPLLIHHQPVHLGSPLHFEQGSHAGMHPPDHAMLLGFGHKTCAVSSLQRLPEPRRHFPRCGRVSQLPAQGRNARRVARFRPADLRTSLPNRFRRHLPGWPPRQLLPPFDPFCRNLACTASLLNSRNASAAIHRPARVPFFLILSALSIASRFNRIFRLPILRSAQFTALRTKLRSSEAWRSITFKYFWKGASSAALSCTAR